MSDRIEEVLEKVNALQERLASCKDDRQAISIQQELVDLLKETLEDVDLITDTLIKSKNI